MNTRIKIRGNEVRIYIDDILHLLVKDRITSIQSWSNENKWFCIEIQTKNNSTLLEYDSKSKWQEILKLLDTIET